MFIWDGSRLLMGISHTLCKSIGIDESSYCKGKKYATVVYDMDKGCVVWVSKGKNRETIDSFY